MHAYPKVWHLGHKNVIGMANSPVIVQEKYDGSQFSFMRTEDGDLVFKSRRIVLDNDNPGDLFLKTVQHLQANEQDIVVNWIYRGEAFKSNKHNTKKYDRVPDGHLVLFDIEKEHHTFMTPFSVASESHLLGVEHAALLVTLREGEGVMQEYLDELLDTESSLGGGKVEGVVFKNYKEQTWLGEPMFAKFVSEEFKESHKQNLDWKQGKDLYHALGSQFATEARWRKSVQRLRDDGKLEDSPRDIGILLKELSTDLLYEYGDELKKRVWSAAWKRISKAANAGFPEWYKRELAFGTVEGTGQAGNGTGGEGHGGTENVGGGEDEDNGQPEVGDRVSGEKRAIAQGDGDDGDGSK